MGAELARPPPPGDARARSDRAARGARSPTSGHRRTRRARRCAAPPARRRARWRGRRGTRGCRSARTCRAGADRARPRPTGGAGRARRRGASICSGVGSSRSIQTSSHGDSSRSETLSRSSVDSHLGIAAEGTACVIEPIGWGRLLPMEHHDRQGRHRRAGRRCRRQRGEQRADGRRRRRRGDPARRRPGPTRRAPRDLVARIGSLPTGQAAWTEAGDMPARWVIHVVGPVHSRTEDRTELLASCYRNALAVADELGATSIAFPAVSAGIYGWPIDDAADVAVSTVDVDADRGRRRPLRAVQRRRPARVPAGVRGPRVMPPPDCIELADVGAALRRYTRDDLDLLHTAIEESRDHLRPFMPWADGTRTDTNDVPHRGDRELERRHRVQLRDLRRRRRAGRLRPPRQARPRRVRDRLLAACRRHWPGRRHRRGAGAHRRRVRPP